MIADILRRLIEGIVSPRASARWILSGHHSVQTAILMSVLGYMIVAIVSVVMSAFTPQRPGVAMNPLVMHLTGLLLRVLGVFVLGTIIHGAGRLFGGNGTRRQAFVIAGWHSLVTSLLAPLMLLGGQSLSLESGGAQIAVIFSGLVYIWLLACYVTELHGFRSVGAVLATMLGVSMVIGMILLNLIPVQR